jgi:hypothetical protein
MKSKILSAFVVYFVIVGTGCRTQPAPTPVVPTPVSRSPRGVDTMVSTTSVALPSYLQPANFNVVKFLGAPPRDDSKEHEKEIKLLLALQDLRTPSDEARCRDEEGMTAFWFANVVGPWFTEKNLPYTAKLMHDVGQEAKAVTGSGKKTWKRVRPPLADRRIRICVDLETTYSYPSGHATIGAFWATILAEMFPVDRDIIMARGAQFGFDRLVAGIHWPSDVLAGQRLGQEIAHRMLEDPEFRGKLDKAKAECLAAMGR